MMFAPLLLNSIILWIQDAFLKGDKHAEERKKAQEAYRRRWQKIHDLRREDPNDPGASDYSDKEAENEFVLIDQSKQNDRLIRQIEEGVYNIKREDYDPDGMLKERRRSL